MNAPQPEAVQLRQRKGDFDIMYTITTSPGGRTDTADTIPHALAALINQLTTGLPNGPVTWSITDPNGDEHRGREYLNGRLELLQEAVHQLADELYTELHRSADGGPPATGH